MRQAIVTRFLGPTNHRGARVKATADAGTVTVSWDYALGISENHERAALALLDKLGWTRDPWRRDLVGGSMPGSGFVFVIT